MKKLLLLCLLISGISSAQTITGTTKTETESIPFSHIIFKNEAGKVYGATSDIDGVFTIQTPIGNYEVEATAVGFQTIRVQKFIVQSDTTIQLVFVEDKKLLNEVVVTSVAQKATTTTVISTIRTLPVVSDGISIESIRRTPDRNVADALKRVSGVTIQGDRFVLVRGLADRYNLARFNKTTLPSTEPDRRAFSFDIIPTALIDNLIIVKSAAADLPGDFTGGLISITTKEVSEDFTTISLGTGWGSVSSAKGFSLVQSTKFPSSFPSTYDFRIASTYDRLIYSGTISSPSPNRFTSIPNTNLSVTIGKDFGKLKSLFSTTIRNNYGLNYTNRKDYQSSTELAYNYSDTLFTQTLSVNSLMNFTYIGENKYSWKTIYAYQSTNSFLKRSGDNYDNVQSVLSTSSNHIKNSVINSQIDGKWLGINFDAGYNFVHREQPDYRVNPIVKSLGSESDYSVAWRDTYRFWSVLNEHSGNLNLNKQISNYKFGIGYTKRIRNFNARVFRYDSENLLNEITNNTDRYSADVNFGNAFGLYSKDFGKMNVSGGVRSEFIGFNMETADFGGQSIFLKNSFVNVLPSINLSYNLDKVKWRASVSRTVSRPEFREVANFAYYDFVRNAQIVGNPNLKLANITNIDLKWELYPSKTETMFVTLFGKQFSNPIEQVVDNGSVPSNLLLTYKNPNAATLYGIEFELRKNLTQTLSAYTNTALMKSQVKVDGVSRQLQGQSNYIINGGLNYQKGNNTLNLSYNRIGERISAVGFQGYADIWENSRDVIDFTYLHTFGKLEIKLTVNDVLAQPSVYFQRLQDRELIKTNNEQIFSFNLNYKL